MKVETVELEIERVRLLCVRITGPITDAEYSHWLDRYKAIHISAREKTLRLVVLLDLTNAPPLTAEQRRLQAEWNERLDAVVHSVTLAVAFVTKSAIIRGVMTAIFWFTRPKAAHQTFSDPAEGLDWLLDSCENAGHPITPSQRRAAHERILPTALHAGVTRSS